MEAVSATQGRAILTVLGSDRAGIVAAITQVLAHHDANILDISQTILQGIFTMTMLVDLTALSVEFDALKEELDEVAQSLGVQVMLQREDVFRFMYRL
ncbi:ACT domain-containing protein [Olsenella sp. KGMB02461]|nr:ACT domain-containing protein [Olsenella sp. KGMB02461]